MKTTVSTGSGFCSQPSELLPALLMKLSWLLPKGKSKLRCKNHIKRNPEIVQPPGSIPSLHSEILFFTYSLELSKGNMIFATYFREEKLSPIHYCSILEKILKRNQVKGGRWSSMFFRVNILLIKIIGFHWVNYILILEIQKNTTVCTELRYSAISQSFLHSLNSFLFHGVLLPKQGTTSLPTFL